jgi:hypothetical protein
LALQPHKGSVSFPAKDKTKIFRHGKTIDEDAGMPQGGVITGIRRCSAKLPHC